MPFNKSNALHDACGKGQLRKVKEILTKGGDIISLLEAHLGFLGYTPLHAAACQGHDDILKLLVIYGGDVNCRANGGYTPLHITASLGFVKCIEVLLKNNANIRALDDYGKTPYETAIRHNHHEAAKTLKSAEIVQAAKDNPQQLERLIIETAGVGITPNCFLEALIEASHFGKLDAACILLKNGATNIKDCVGVSMKRGHYDITVLLLINYAALEENLTALQDLLQKNVECYEFLDEFLDKSLAKETIVWKIRESLQKGLENCTRVAIQLLSETGKYESLKMLMMYTSCCKDSQKVNWCGLSLPQIHSTVVESIKSWVQELDLSDNRIKNLPKEFVDLKLLTKLNLSKNKLKTLPVGLFSLPRLRSLNVSGNYINELPEFVEFRTALKTLNLRENNLSNLPQGLARSCLETLDLARNHFNKVPLVVCEITSLTILILSDNRDISYLPLEMGKLRNLTRIDLANLEMITDPPEKYRQDAKDLVGILRKKLRTCEPYYKMKLMLVGKGAQGKTTLVHRLKEDYTFQGNDLTQGVEISELVIRKSAFHRLEYVFKVWDFGGQEDYYATHQCFLSTMSLYLLVWRLIDGEEGVNGLIPWLDNIAVRSPGSTVIIVGTHLDCISVEKHGPNHVQYLNNLVRQLVQQQRYEKKVLVPEKAIVAVSCAIGERRTGIHNLRLLIYNTAATLKKGRHFVMGEQIPSSFLSLIERLEQRKRELLVAKKPPIIRKEEFSAMVEENQLYKKDVHEPQDVRDATVFLRERGIVMHFDDPNEGLNDLYFIDPRWLCALMARVVTVKTHADLVKEGILEIQSTKILFRSDDLPFDFYAQYIRLLVRFQIAYLLDESRILVPSKLPEIIPDEVDQMCLPFAPVRRAYKIDYQQLHGFWPRFISRFFFYMKEMIAVDPSRYQKDGTQGFVAKFCRSCVHTDISPASKFPCRLDDSDYLRKGIDEFMNDDSVSTVSEFQNDDTSSLFQHDTDLQALLLDPTVRLFTEEEFENEEADGMVINDVKITGDMGGHIPGYWKQGNTSKRKAENLEKKSGSDSSKQRTKSENSDASSTCSDSRSKSSVATDVSSSFKSTSDHMKEGDSTLGDDISDNRQDNTKSTSLKEKGLIENEVVHSGSDLRLILETLHRDSDTEEDAKGKTTSCKKDQTKKGNATSNKTAEKSSKDDAASPSREKLFEEDVAQDVNLNDIAASANSWKSISEMSTGIFDVSMSDVTSNTTGSLQSDGIERVVDVEEVILDITHQDDPSADVNTDTEAMNNNNATYDQTDDNHINCDTNDIESDTNNIKSDTCNNIECDTKNCTCDANYIESDANVIRSGTNNIKSDVNDINYDANNMKSDADIIAPDANDIKSGANKIKSGANNINYDTKSWANNVESDSKNIDSDANNIETDHHFAKCEVIDTTSNPLPQNVKDDGDKMPHLSNGKHFENSTSVIKSVSGMACQKKVWDSLESSQSSDVPSSSHTRSETFGSQSSDASQPTSDQSCLPDDVIDGSQATRDEDTYVDDSTKDHDSCATELCTLCKERTPVTELVAIPLDVADLIERKFMKCWRSGVLFDHPKLYTTVSYRSLVDSVIVETAVSPSPLGRRLLTFIVDHLDTLIQEWYPGLTTNRDFRCNVEKLIPCRSCEKTDPTGAIHMFTFDACVTQYSMGDYLKCPRHEVSIHDIAPDVVLHDIEADLLLQEHEIVYEKSEAYELGKGFFGKVYRGVCRGQDAAIKEYSTPHTEEDALARYSEVRKELNVLRRVGKHPYLVNLIGVCLRPFRLVLELAIEGSLDQTVFKPNFAIDRVVVHRMIWQVTEALCFLHSLNVIYRDLKPPNVLVLSYNESAEINIKVTDFGTATFQFTEGLAAVQGTTGFNAPEMLRGPSKRVGYDEKVDVFSLAMLIYTFITRKHPFYHLPTQAEVNAAVGSGKEPEYKDVTCSRVGYAGLTWLMKKCMKLEPASRPYAAAVANQVRQLPFQLFLGVIALPCSQSVRHVCYVEVTNELWVATDDKTTNKVLIYDLDLMQLKKKVTVNRLKSEEVALCMQVNCMHVTEKAVLIGLRGDFDVVTFHDILTYGIVAKITLTEPVFCITSNQRYIFLGMSSGLYRVVPMSGEGETLSIEVSNSQPITCMVAIQNCLWVTVSKCIQIFNTEEEDGMDAFELNSVRFRTSKSACSHAVLSKDHNALWCVSKGDSIVTGWNVKLKEKLCEIDCKQILRQVYNESEQLTAIDVSVTCVLPALDTVWVGTAAGLLLILDAESGELITWLHPLVDHVRTLTLVPGPGPCSTENCYVVATGKTMADTALSRNGKVLCRLSLDEIQDEPKPVSPAKTNNKTVKKSKPFLRTVSPFKVTTPPPCKNHDITDGHVGPQCGGVLLFFEALPAKVLRRMEAKSSG